MKKFLISDLAKIIKASLDARCSMLDTRRRRKSSIENRESSIKQFFTGVSIDSRTAAAGDCFFAITGENFDGHDYVSDAFSKGAVCAVVSKKSIIKKQTGKTILEVDDTIKALCDFARDYRRRCGFKVVAITGSAGKTTVRQIVYHVLSQKYNVFQAPKNFNNNIGLPLTLLGADPEHQIVIAELGTSHPGEIAYLTRIAQPNIAVVTNVYPAHLEGFGNLQAIVKEKLSIAEGLSSDGILIINADLAGCLSNYQLPVTNNKVLTFGKSDGSDYQARDLTRASSPCCHGQDGRGTFGFGSSFSIDDTEIYLPLAGPGNIENALAAWAVCSRLGITIEDFARRLKTLLPVPMRAEALKFGTLTVINDCYNANPASMRNALNILTTVKNSKFPASGRGRRLVFICGEMAELGNQSEQLHAELGSDIAGAKVQLLIAVGKSAKIAAVAAKETAGYNLKVEYFNDTISACNNLQKFIKDNDIILVKGSRTAKLEMAVEKLKELPICARRFPSGDANRKTKVENRK